METKKILIGVGFLVVLAITVSVIAVVASGSGSNKPNNQTVVNLEEICKDVVGTNLTEKHQCFFYNLDDYAKNETSGMILDSDWAVEGDKTEKDLSNREDLGYKPPASGTIIALGDNKDRVLVLYDNRGFWDFPFGGGEYYDGSIWAAATREFREECGKDINGNAIRWDKDGKPDASKGVEYIEPSRKSSRMSSSKHRFNSGHKNGAWHYVLWIRGDYQAALRTLGFQGVGTNQKIHDSKNSETKSYDAPKIHELLGGYYDRKKVRGICKSQLEYAISHYGLDGSKRIN